MSVMMSAADVSPIPMKIQETMVSQAGTAMSLILSPSSERPLFSERLWCFLPARYTWPPAGSGSVRARPVPDRPSVCRQWVALADGNWPGWQFNSEIGHLSV